MCVSRLRQRMRNRGRYAPSRNQHRYQPYGWGDHVREHGCSGVLHAPPCYQRHARWWRGRGGGGGHNASVHACPLPPPTTPPYNAAVQRYAVAWCCEHSAPTTTDADDTQRDATVCAKPLARRGTSFAPPPPPPPNSVAVQRLRHRLSRRIPFALSVCALYDHTRRSKKK